MTWWRSFCGSAHVVVAWLEGISVDQSVRLLEHKYSSFCPYNEYSTLLPVNMQLCAYSHYCDRKTAVMRLPLRTLVATVFRILRDNGFFFSAAMRNKQATLNAAAGHTEILDAVLKEFTVRE